MIWAILAIGCVMSASVCFLLVVSAVRSDSLAKKIVLDERLENDPPKCQQVLKQTRHSYVVIPEVQMLNFEPPCDIA